LAIADCGLKLRNPKSEIRNLAVAALASILFASVPSIPCSVAAELQWRPGRTPAASRASESSAKSWQEPGTRSSVPPKMRDGAVRQAAWQDPAGEGPGLGSPASGQATLRSLVVRRNDVDEPLRSAQLSQPDNAAAAATEQAASGQQMQTGTDSPTRSGSQPDSLPRFQTPQFDRPFGETPAMQTPADQTILPPARTELPGGSPDPQSMFQPGATSLPSAQPGLGLAAEPAADDEEQRSREVCDQQMEALRKSRLSDVKLDIRVTGTEGVDYPYLCSIDDGTWHAGRSWPCTTYMWKASALCHKPLYFEDEQMERYGHSWGPCCDPIVSGVHFFTTLPVLPYCMGLEPPCECIYALGHYRPGSCAPYYIDPVPFSWRAALFQAGAVVGTAAILP
jgi:hypothetical protein